METSGYNLRQRPFLVSTTTDSSATVVTSSVSTVMSYPPAGSGSSGSTGGATTAPTMSSLCQETLGADSARGIGIGLAVEPVDSAASSGGLLLVQSNVVNVDDVTVSTAELAQSAVRPTSSVLPLLTQQQVTSASARAEMQATMEKEIERREREAAEKACLQMELAQLKKDIAVAEERDSCAVAFTAAGSSAAQHARRQYRCWCVSAIYKRHPRTDNISSQSSTCVAASYYRQRDPC